MSMRNFYYNPERYDLISKISSQDPKAFNEFDVIDLNDLPDP